MKYTIIQINLSLNKKIPLAMGVVCAFIFDIKLNLIGTMYASLGVLVTSLYQVVCLNSYNIDCKKIFRQKFQWVSENQQSLQMDAMQLLYYQAPLSAAILLVIVPFIEPVTSTLSRAWSPRELGMVFGSGVASLFVNLTIYWLLGNTSPLTYVCSLF
jgi:solute carrier family 35, member E3